MRIRGFDKHLWIAIAVVVPSLIGLFLLSARIGDKVQVDPLFVFLFFAGVVWLIAYSIERRLRKLAEPETEPVFCEWGARINSTSFSANEEFTRLSLESYGLDLQSAVGKTFVCMTECAGDGKDYYFKGTFVRSESGDVVVRAIHPEQLPVF